MSDTSDSDLSMLMALSDWDEDSEIDTQFYSEYLSDEDDDDNVECEVEPTIECQSPRMYKSRLNSMAELNDAEFTYRFRLSKTAVNNLLTEIYPFMRVTSRRNHGISPLHQLLLALRFYALGTMLVSIADFLGVSKSSATRTVADVSSAIACLYKKYVYVHNDTHLGFYNISQFPKVLGAMDTTHVRIQSPSSNSAKEFRNGSGYFSLNVQAVCDAELQLMDVVSEPGATDDATMFNNSTLKYECENAMYGDRWLVGDSAYPCRPYLLTPVLKPTTRSDALYNEAHTKVQNTIQRCFEVWKRRFPILSFKLRLALPTTQSIIIATAVLYNICKRTDIQDLEPEVEIPEYEDVPKILDSSMNENISERQELINSHFNRFQ